jgi:hypothetical protein
MAETTVDTLLVKIKADTKQLEGELKKLQGKTQQTSKNMSKGFMQFDKGLARTVRNIGLVGGAIGAVFGGIAIKKIINVGSEIEGLQIRLKALFGSAEEGSKAFEKMAEFASRVPFSLQEIQTGSGALAAVADDAEHLGEILTITGNVAAITGLDFATTSMQIQRSFSAGIGAADLFRERAVRSLLGFQAGADVSVEETIAKFREKFGKGGEFGQTTDELADTLSGTLSMIGDKVFNFQRLIADERFFNSLKEQFGDLNKFLDDNRENIDQLALSLGSGLADALERVVSGMIFLNENMEKVKLTFGLLTGLVAAAISPYLLLAGAIGIAGNELKKFVDERNKANTVLNPFTEGGTNQAFGMGTGGEGFTAKVPKAKVVVKDPAKLTEALANMEREIQLLGLKNDKEREFQKILNDTGLKEQIHIDKLREKFDLMKSLEEAQMLNNEIMQDAQSIIEGNKTEQEKLNEQILIFEEALMNVAEEDVPKVQEALVILKDELRELDPLMQEITQIFERASTSISQAIADSITDGKNLMSSLANITKQVVNQMIAEFLRLKVIQPLISSIFGGGQQQSGGGIGGFFGSLFGGGGGGITSLFGGGGGIQSAQGFGQTASFMLGGAFSGRAGGGTIAPNRAVMVGERGPEIFVPNSGGKIVPNHNMKALGGQETVINQNINITTGVSQTVRAEVLNMLPAIKQETLQAVADSRLRGGTFGAAFTR